MYRVHNTTNSPFQIDTAKGTTIVPAYGSAIADLTEEQRAFLDGYPDYRCEPVEYGKPEPVAAPDPVAAPEPDEREAIMAELRARGIQFHHKTGLNKLRKLLDGANS